MPFEVLHKIATLFKRAANATKVTITHRNTVDSLGKGDMTERVEQLAERSRSLVARADLASQETARLLHGQDGHDDDARTGHTDAADSPRRVLH